MAVPLIEPDVTLLSNSASVSNLDRWKFSAIVLKPDPKMQGTSFFFKTHKSVLGSKLEEMCVKENVWAYWR